MLTKELFSELLHRVGKGTCIEIQVAKLIQIGFYPKHINGPRYIVSAESHDSLDTTSFDEAYEAFYKLWDPDE